MVISICNNVIICITSSLDIPFLFLFNHDGSKYQIKNRVHNYHDNEELTHREDGPVPKIRLAHLHETNQISEDKGTP